MFDFFLISLIIYYLLSTIAYFFFWRHWSRQERLCFAVLFFCLPFFGLFYYLPRFYRLANRLVNTAGLAIKKPANSFANAALHDKIRYGSDILPLADVLQISGIADKRTILTDAIRQKTLTNQKLLFAALHDEDREISHYAVSIITNELDNAEAARLEMQQRAYNGQELTADTKILAAYSKVLDRFLKMQQNDDLTTERFNKEHTTVLEKLLQLQPTAPNFKAVIENYFQNNAWTKTLAACHAYQAAFPDAEDPWLLLGRLAIIRRDQALLQKAIDGLKQLPVALSDLSLRFIRYWSLH